MASYDIAEVEQAFQHYWKTGAVDEDWDGFADNFTDDAHYIEHYFGDIGRETIRGWIKPIMDQFGELYTAYEWHMCGTDGRVVVYMQNRHDNPDPSAPPIDFPGVTILQYRATANGRSRRTIGRSKPRSGPGRSTRRRVSASMPTTRRSARDCTGATGRTGRRVGQATGGERRRTAHRRVIRFCRESRPRCDREVGEAAGRPRRRVVASAPRSLR